MRARRVFPALMLLLAAGVPFGPPAAEAAFPGANGQIAFASGRTGNGDIYAMEADGTGAVPLTTDPAQDSAPTWSADATRIAFSRTTDGLTYSVHVMNADGSGETNLTTNLTYASEPSWSPDGTRIAFRSLSGNHEVFVMNADGSGQENLTQNAAFDTSPAWSPDGTKIAFQSGRGGNNDVWVMNAADGSGPTNLTQAAGGDDSPAWSPDGTKIAFVTTRDLNDEVYVMNADGSGQVNLTNHPADDNAPEWSPDGTKIAFYSDREGDSEIFVMNADGSGQTNLTNNMEPDDDPAWQPQFEKSVSLKAKPKTVGEGERTRLKARVSPCEGHEGDVVEFYRKKKRIAQKKSNDRCVAKFTVKVRKTTRFKAISPKQDIDHLEGVSKKIKVKVTG